MAERHPSLIGVFYKVGNIYYYDRPTNGRRLRISTHQTTLDSAAEWVMSRPFGSRHVRKPVAMTRALMTKMFHRAKDSAKERRLPFTLTRQDLDELYAESNGFCAVSGLPFDLRELDGSSRRPYMPSIDRIDHMCGYTRKNCRIVCVAVNLAMNDFGEQVLWDIAASMVILRDRKRRQANSCHKSSHSNVSKNSDKSLILGG